jgi:hypothetical protein
MLFDLRGRGRRRTVRVVYLGLAILFGLSFIGFGVGTGFGGGGIFEGIFGSKEGTSGSTYGKQVSSAEARTRRYPSEAAAWAALANARIHESSQSEFYDEATQQFTSQGKELLAKAAAAWTHYTSFNPSKPSMATSRSLRIRRKIRVSAIWPRRRRSASLPLPSVRRSRLSSRNSRRIRLEIPRTKRTREPPTERCTP